jgi:hypothetical protein
MKPAASEKKDNILGAGAKPATAASSGFLSGITAANIPDNKSTGQPLGLSILGGDAKSSKLVAPSLADKKPTSS